MKVSTQAVVAHQGVAAAMVPALEAPGRLAVPGQAASPARMAGDQNRVAVAGGRSALSLPAKQGTTLAFNPIQAVVDFINHGTTDRKVAETKRQEAIERGVAEGNPYARNGAIRDAVMGR